MAIELEFNEKIEPGAQHAVDVEWAWQVDTRGNRRYRILRGERAGQYWDGARAKDANEKLKDLLDEAERRNRELANQGLNAIINDVEWKSK